MSKQTSNSQTMLPEAEDCAIILTVHSAYGAESMENLPKQDNKSIVS